MRKPLSQHPAGGKAVWSGPCSTSVARPRSTMAHTPGPAEAADFRGARVTTRVALIEANAAYE